MPLHNTIYQNLTSLDQVFGFATRHGQANEFHELIQPDRGLVFHKLSIDTPHGS